MERFEPGPSGRFIKRFRGNASSNGETAKVFRGVRIKFKRNARQRRNKTSDWHAGGGRTARDGGGKNTGIVVDRGRILHSCVEAITRAGVSFLCRLFQAETFREEKSPREREEGERGATFPPPWNTRGKGSYLGLLVYLLPFLVFPPASLSSSPRHRARLSSKGLHFSF